jgi:uncharacterized protein (TIGR01244 family)
MKIVQLTDTVSVSEQITAVDVAEVAAAGFKVLINNRPDGEVPGQPGSDEIAIAAEAAGLSYFYLPITAFNFPGPDIELMSSLFNNPDEPALAFCRSGTRCTNLWITTRSEDETDEAIARGRALGYDLSMASSVR